MPTQPQSRWHKAYGPLTLASILRAVPENRVSLPAMVALRKLETNTSDSARITDRKQARGKGPTKVAKPGFDSTGAQGETQLQSGFYGEMKRCNLPKELN